MNNVSRKYEREIELKDIFFKILFNWRKIIIVSILFSLLFGGYRFVRDLKNMFNEDFISLQEKEYNNNLKEYDANLYYYNNKINNITNNIKRQEDYNDNSLLMKVDPYNKYVSSITYYVDTNYLIMPNLTYQNVDTSTAIISAYKSIGLNADLYDYVVRNLSFSTEVRYIQELIDLYTESDTNMIYIKVFSYDEKTCDEIYNLVYKYFEIKQKEINNKIGEHSLSVINNNILRTEIDYKLEDIQKENNQMIIEYRKSLQEAQKAEKALIKPVQYVYTSSKIVKGSIKYAGLGFFIGAFISFCCLLLTILMSDKLINSNELRSRYNLKILGEYSTRDKKKLFNFVDTIIFKMEGRYHSCFSESEAIKRIVFNISNLFSTESSENNSVLLTGTINDDDIELICKKLINSFPNTSLNFRYGGNLNYSADTLNEVGKCNAIIIIEKINTSSNYEIINEINSIKELKKKIIGAIVLR